MEEEKSEKSRKVILRKVTSAMAKEKVLKAIVNRNGRKGKILEIINNRNDAFFTVIIEMELFSQAESFIREINEMKGKHLIRAELVWNKYNDDKEDGLDQVAPVLIPAQESTVSPDWDIPIQKPKVTFFGPPIEFEKHSHDDVMERVSQFEFFLLQTTSLENYRKYFERLKSKSIPGTSKLITFPTCFRCKKNANYINHKTKLNFCSMTCFNQHYEIDDIPIPYEINYAEAPEVKDKVKISAIINEKCLYLKKANYGDGPMRIKLGNFAKNSKKLENVPKIGDFVIALCNEIFYRAQVINVSEIITVCLFDFGNTFRVKLTDLYEMSQECLGMKCHAFKMFLANVETPCINNEMVKYLNSLKYGDDVELTIVEKDGNKVVLKEQRTIVNDKIQSLANLESSYDGEHFEVPISQQAELKKYFVVNKKAMSIENCIVMYTERELKDFYELYRAINEYGNCYKGKKTGRTSVHKDCYEIVKYNGQFHRGLLVKSSGDGKPEYVLVDNGKIAKIPVDDIIPCPRVWQNQGIFCLYGKLSAEEHKKVKENSFIDAALVMKVSGDIEEIL